MSTWIQTFSGKCFDLAEPYESPLSILDLTWALSQICRFNGHTKFFYSVAEHSCYVCDHAPAEHKLVALLHDAEEAFVGDQTSPFLEMFPKVRDYRNRLRSMILNKFGLSATLPQEVKDIDLRMLRTEQEQAMSTCRVPWESTKGVEPFDLRIGFWAPHKARAEFTRRFNEVFVQTET